MRRPLHITREILSDPGFGFSVCNILYLSKINEVTLAAAFFCAGLIIALRCLRHAGIAAADSPRLHKLVHEEGSSLRLLGVMIIGCSLYTFAQTFVAGAGAAGWHYAVLHATSGLLFATGNFMLANHYERRTRLERSIMATLAQPETWMAAGMLCLGLMAGPVTLVAFPFVIAGYVIAVRNVYHARAAHAGHPKLYYAAATMAFAALAQDPVLVAANLINAAYLVIFECQLTPGGARGFWCGLGRGLGRWKPPRMTAKGGKHA